MIPNPPPGQGPIDPRGAFATPGVPMGPTPPMQSQMQSPTQTPMHPSMTPPPFFFAPPRPRGFSVLRGIASVLATLLFAFSIMLNFALLFPSDQSQTVLSKGDAGSEIAVIPIDGVISTGTADRIEKLLRDLEKNSSVKALVLEINSPGGELSASDEIYTRLKKFKDEKKIPIVIAMGGLATSGGYYIACAGDYIFAEPTTLTANIGVVFERFNFSGLMEKYGVQETSITPAASKYKNVESPFRPDTPETRAYLASLVDQHFERFKSVVTTGRAGKLTGPIEQIADGRALSADAALKDGLIDEIKYADAAYAKAATLAGISKPNVVRYKAPFGFFGMLSDSALKLSPAKIESPEVRIDRRLIDDLTTPRVMSIYRGG